MRRCLLLVIVLLTSCTHTPMPQQATPHRDRSLSDLDLHFTPAVFTGDTFPPCDFENPTRARQILGEYTITPSFYDTHHNPVTRPTLPGRYGARISITSPHYPNIAPRLLTLFQS